MERGKLRGEGTGLNKAKSRVTAELLGLQTKWCFIAGLPAPLIWLVP